MTDWRLLNDGVVELWNAKDEEEFENTRIELHRIEQRSNWQFSMEDGPFSGYPAINVCRKDLEELYGALEKELFPERFMKKSEPDSEKAYRDRYNETGLA